MFLAAQPELNWRNPELVAAMHATLRFWLDRGIDGFRVDVVHGLGKDPALPDDPSDLVPLPHAALNDHESTHGILRDLRRVVDAYPGDRVLVGEVYLLVAKTHARYYGRGDELHLVFELPAVILTDWDAADWRARMAHVAATHDPIGAWPTWVLSNHDTPRHRTRHGSEARARAAAVLLLGLRGTPFLYAGEELGLEDAVVPHESTVDPGGRDGCRAPLPWTPGPRHGWPADPWLPFPPDSATRNVEALRADPSSILHLYRRLLAARRASPALRLGEQTLRPAPDGVVAWDRTAGADRRTILVNFTDRAVACAAEGTVEVASDGAGEGRAWAGTLAPDQAVVLR
jgi:alpha-glucosidase